MQISQVMTSNFDQNMMKKDISANLYWKCFILCTKILTSKGAPQYEHTSFVTMTTYWVPDLPNI